MIIYRVYSTRIIAHGTLFNRGLLSTFFGIQTMSQSGLGPVSSLGDDRRPKISNGRIDSKDWITGIRYYVNSMKDRCPDEYHPDEEWLSQGFEMILLDRERMVTTAPK